MNWPKKLSAGIISLMMAVPSNAIGVLAQESEEPVPEEEIVEVVEEATIEEETPVEISEEEAVVEEEEIAEEPAEEISEEEITEEVPEETVETVEEAPAEDEVEIVEEVVEETEVEEVAEGENDLESQKAAFLETLENDGYAEFGAYHVEKIKDGVYHMDEELKSCPGGANLPDYVDIDTGETKTGVMNNPSSMYFVVTDNEVVMIDGGDVLRSQEKFDSAKAIIEAMAGEKPLTFIITHGHSDHVRMVTTEGVLDNVNVKAVYIGKDDYMADENKVVGSTTAVPLPLTVDKEKVHTVKEGDVITVDGLKYDIIDIPAHTPGSLAIVQQDKAVVFTGDSIGSGFVWAFWMYGDNPLGALQDGVKKLQDVVKNMTGASILAGHRWQQFYDFGDGSQPKEMGIQYLNDMSAVISGLANGTTMRSPYTLRGNEDDIELSATGSKAKVDTQQPCIDAYLKSLVQIDEAYVYSGASKLSIETENNVAAPTFVIYPDKALTDEEAQKLLDDSGLTATLDRTASKAFVIRPIGTEYGEADIQRFKDVVQKQVAVCENFKLIGIGSGATFINKYLTPYMNFVSGLALIGGEAGETPKASVPTYISGSAADPAAYIAANKAVETGEGTYANPDSRFEIVVVNKADEEAAAGIKNAWDKVLNKFGRIGNLIDNSDGNRDTIGTWYSRPLISGNDAADQARVYQYFDSLDAITGLKREVVTEDLDGDGQLNLWYEYIPASAENAEKGTVPAILLMHGNTNDPRTQVDTAAWANIAVDENVILIAPEWQGHVYQGYTYQPMITDINNPTGDGYDDSAFIKMIEKIEEKYPQLDPTRLYISGLSAGSRNTLVQGLKNGKYIAAGAGHSGAWGVTGGAENADVVANKDAYDFPIIFFAGDADEYMKAHYDTVDATAGPITTIQAYQGLNNMEPLKAADLDAKYIAESGYPVPFDETYTIDANAENVATIKGGILVSDKNVEISLNRIYGWGHWNYAPATKMMWDFMKKYARDPETGASIRLDMDEKEGGVTVDGNDVTFTYVDEDEKDAVKVTVSGNFQWYKWDEVDGFDAAGDNSHMKNYDAYKYEEGMFNTGYGINGDSAVYELKETADETFELNLTLPGNLYYYDYTVEYADGTSVKIKDPANMPMPNEATGKDAGHSLFYVGDAKNTTKGQEYIYERTDDKKGSYGFVPYTATDGTTQYLGVYLPYEYDESETYNVVYVSHGGGGNENEWMTIGAVPNILDNLIADGEVDPTIAVTMDHTYFNWDYDKIIKNFEECIIPFMEENYPVSKNAEDRALCGLSMGSMTTTTIMQRRPDLFGYYGAFSGANILDEEVDVTELSQKVIYLSAGVIDMAYYQSKPVGPGKTVDIANKLKELGISFNRESDEPDVLGGAHDWGVWRESFTNFAKDYLWEIKPYMEGTQTVHVVGDDWGPAVDKVMIALEDKVKAADLKADAFTVVETKEAFDWAERKPTTAVTEREVLDVYLCDEEGNKIDGKSGNIIAIEMYVSPSVGSPFYYEFDSGFNRWVDEYNLAVKGTIGGKLLKSAQDIDFYDNDMWVSELADKFNQGEFKGPNNTLTYGEFIPEADGKKPLFIWLHGAGEGTYNGKNDNYIDLLGNEVTAFADEEFQSMFENGAYVVTPQAPTMWMDDGTGKYVSEEAGNAGQTKYDEDLFAFIEDYVAKHDDIDADNIIIGGCSNGGYMTVNMILKHPDYFAKAYPICEAYYDSAITDEEIQALAEGGTGVWFTFADADTTVDPTKTSIPTYNRLKEAGGDVHKTQWADVHDTTGRFKDAGDVPHVYAGHWSWIYFDNNSNYCDEHGENEWEWLATKSNEVTIGGIVTDAGEYVDYMTVDFGDAEISGVDNDTFKVMMTSTVDYGEAKGQPYKYYDATKPLKVVKTEVEGGLVKVYFQQDQAPVLTWLAEGRNYPAVLNFTVTQEKPFTIKVDGTEKLYTGLYVSKATSWKDLANEELAKFEDVQDEINYQFHKGTNEKLIVFFHGNGEGDFPVKDTNNNIAQILANRGGAAWVSEEAQEVFGDASVMAFQAPNMWYFAIKDNLLEPCYNEIQKVIEENHIDPDEVYLSGASAGGFMSTRMIIAYPDLFKAAMINCPALDAANARSGSDDAIPTDEELAQLKDSKTAIWLVQGETDSSVDPELCSKRIWNIITEGEEVSEKEYEGDKGIASGFTTYETKDGKYKLSLYKTFDLKEVEGISGEKRQGGVMKFAEDYDQDGTYTEVKYNDHWSWIFTLRDNPEAADGTHIWEWAVAYTDKEIVSGTQTVHVVGDDWGPAVDKTVITLEKEVKAADLKADEFTVVEVKEAFDWAAFKPTTAVTDRKVLNVYLSDAEGNKVEDESGKIIAVELYVSPNEGSPFYYDVFTGFNRWVDEYNLNVRGYVGDVKVKSVQDIDFYDNDMWTSELADKFNQAEFKGPNNTLVYGEYVPEDGGKDKALVIWLHGAGEGTNNGKNDNYIDLLGNEVTAFADEEFQSLFGGAYVVTPQAPTMWMDDGNGAYISEEEGDAGQTKYDDDLFAFIEDYVAKHEDIDPERVIIGGCSNGGYMTVNMILKHPDYFYKAFPICEAYYDSAITDKEIKALAEGGTGIWFTFADADTTVNPKATSIPTYNRLKEAGADVHKTQWADVHDTTGRFTGADGKPHVYAGHWSWIYFDNNSNVCDDHQENEWEWLAEPKTKFLFDDVQDETKSFYEPVYWAYENEITTGTSKEPPLFSPFATCTRAQFVTFLWRQQGKPEPTLTESPFKDVQNKELSYYKAVLWAVEKEITTGTSPTTFDPGKKVTRAQAVTFLWRANNKPAPKTTVNPFKDVAAGLSYSDAVLWAFENEITTGTSATTFNPGGDCTRGATVTFLWRTYAKN